MPMTLTRSLLAILIPGLVATTPLLLFLVTSTQTGQLYKDYPYLLNSLFFCLVAIAGSTSEGLGTHMEASWDTEKKLQRKFQIAKNWYAYLASNLDPEPVGFRYMSRLATTLYAELSMSIALVFFGAGSALFVWFQVNPFGESLALVALFISNLVSWYFYWQSRHTYVTLCRTRKQLNHRLGLLG